VIILLTSSIERIESHGASSIRRFGDIVNTVASAVKELERLGQANTLHEAAHADNM
jgi:hypothetical protein